MSVSTSKDSDGVVISGEYRRLDDELGNNYAKIADDMTGYIKIVRDKSVSVAERKNTALRLRNYLIYCSSLMDLDELTDIYCHKENNSIIGYDAAAVARFVSCMVDKYPLDNVRNRYLAHRRRIYGEIGAIMDDCIRTIRTVRDDPDSKEPKVAAKLLRICLDDCLDRPGLNDLTKIYRDMYDDNIIGYDANAVSQFVKQMVTKYPLE